MQQHCDTDDLVLLALGEPVPGPVSEHVEGCEICAAERDAFAAVVTTAREAQDDELLAPAASVWDGIEAELGLDAPRSAPLVGASTGEGFSFPDPELSDDESDRPETSPAPPARGGGAEVVDLASRRTPKSWSWIAAAAAVGVVAGGVGGNLLSNRATEPPATVVAQAPLEPLPDWDGASGEAAVHTAPDGTRTLVLDIDASVPDDGFREVWLIDRDVTRLVSIGVLEGSSGSFVLPTGLDLDDFAVVDVSQEHFDGDPTHSGDSIVRGILDT